MSAQVDITVDGEFVIIEQSESGAATLYIRGTFGGGTLTLGWRDSTGSFQSYKDFASLTEPGERFIPGMGLQTTLMVELVGSTSPNIVIETNIVAEGR